MSIMILMSCEGKIEKPQNEESGTKIVHKSETFNLVVRNIEDMGGKSWNKSEYVNILENQIPQLKQQTEKKAATELLNSTYGKVLVKEVNSIMDGNCSSPDAHGTLKVLFAELTLFTDTPGYQEALNAKIKHDQAVAFANTKIAYQTVKTYEDIYDLKYETDNIRKAKEYLEDSSLKCSSTRNQLEKLSVESSYKGRRNQYCQSIVNNYLKCTDTRKSVLNETKKRLSVCKDDKKVSGWKSEMEKHYNSLQEK